MKDNSSRHELYFHAFLIKDAEFTDGEEFPKIHKEISYPNKIITFSKALRTDDFNQWVCFYEEDYKFMRLVNNPKRYLKILKRFNGVISPDFSIRSNMPLFMQKGICGLGRSFAYWFQENGIKVIPNVRYTDKRCLDFFCLGIEPGGTIAISTLGALHKNKKNNIKKTQYALEISVTKLKPINIVIYGSAPKEIVEKYERQGINIIKFESDTSVYFQKKEKST